MYSLRLDGHVTNTPTLCFIYENNYLGLMFGKKSMCAKNNVNFMYIFYFYLLVIFI